MSIVNTREPITWEGCEGALLALEKRCPQCATEVIGVSQYGRTLRVLRVGRGPRRVLYTAAHHGNEWLTALVLLKFIEDLVEGTEPGLPGASLFFVPMVDPDGVDLVVGAAPPDQVEAARALAANYPEIPFPAGWKANLAGVDLNLSYPAGWSRAREIKFAQGYTRPGPRDYVGRFPLSQPESRALAEYTEFLDPDLVLAYHSQGEVIYWQFEDYRVPGARALGEAFAAASGYALADTPAESSYAGFKDWFIQEFRRPGYTVEVGLGENPLPLSQFPEIYRRNRGILQLAAAGI